MTAQLTSATKLPTNVLTPNYAPDSHGTGIVHIGLGAFHRAHQAVYTDDALAATVGNWRTVCVSLRSKELVDALTSQDCRYSVIVKDGHKTSARIIASIKDALSAPRNPELVMQHLCAETTRIVSLTVTEKAYGVDRQTGGLDTNHPAIQDDLNHPGRPSGVIGYLTEALRLRRANNTPPFTVLCCDNFPENGKLVKRLVSDFARNFDPAFADWITENVSFPSSMVDRITPAPNETSLNEAARILGCTDLSSVETEPFSQWVIEDDFPAGRPDWEAGGALFVDDVAPYEKMKLRMLNGTHSLIAYAGFLCGKAYVRDVMADRLLRKLVERHLACASETLDPVPGINLADYARDLITRFENPAIAHETYQIAMDGTEKLPQRLLEPALENLKVGKDIEPFAFAVALWMRYVSGRLDDGTSYDLRDPRAEALIKTCANNQRSAENLVQAIMVASGIFPGALLHSTTWWLSLAGHMDAMKEKSVIELVNKVSQAQ